MRVWTRVAAFGAFGLIYGATSHPARADTPGVLDEITTTADKICGNVSQSGRSNSEQVTGDVKAELSGLAKKLADLGIAGTGSLTTTEYQGVLQQELSSNLRDIRECKLKVLSMLQSKVISNTYPDRNPNSLYQYGDVIAEVQGAVISVSNGSVTFQNVRNAGKADPTRDVEYQDWILRCPDLPRPLPNTFVGQYIGVVAGETCSIVRKRS